MPGRKVAMQDATAIAANGQNLNVFANSQYVRAPFPGFMTIFGTGSAAGLQIMVVVNGQLVLERMDMNANNRVPIVPDDMIISDVQVNQGDLIQVSEFNTTGGSLTPRTRVEIEEGVYAY